MRRAIIILIVCLAAVASLGFCPTCPTVQQMAGEYPAARDRGTEYVMPPAVFRLYENRRGPKGEGSCVWASCAMAGAHHDVRAAEALLRDPNFGDGAWPERVEREFNTRQIEAWNVEGTESMTWIEWALRTGRYAAITYGHAHMICAVGMRPDGKTIYVVDNNYPSEVRAVSRDVFMREHKGYSGGWAVILKSVGPPPWVPATQ